MQENSITKDEIVTMLVQLKAYGYSVAAVERKIGVGNALLGKAAKGDRVLAKDKFEALKKLHAEVCGIPVPIETKQTVVTPKGELKTIPSKAAKSIVSEVKDRMNKKYGMGTLMTFGEKPKVLFDVISTGSLGLDIATGIGGLPRGRIVEIFGWESTGKSTIALNVIANAQKKNLKCLLIDAENSFDPKYAQALGVKFDALEYCQPSCGEEALDIAEMIIGSGDIGVVVFDSVAALVPKAELNGEMGESKIGLHARLMSQACRKLTSLAEKNNVLLIFINQLRLKIGVMYGSPEVTTGGVALQFYSSMRLNVTRSITEANSIINNGVKEGNLTSVKIVKNKCSTPFAVAQFYILYGIGVDKSREVLELGLQSTVIKKEGNTYSYDGNKIGVGWDVAKQFLDDNPELRNEIEEKLKAIK